MQFFFDEKAKLHEELQLSPEESKHLIRVLRKKTGDTIHLLDGKGSRFKGVLLNEDQRRCVVKVEEQMLVHHPGYRVQMAIAPTKNIARFEWFLEKATEIGVDEIFPVICDRSERRVIKPERLQKVIVSALKQSSRVYLPKLHEAQSLDKFLSYDFGERFIAQGDFRNPHLMDECMSGQVTTVIIGPEGDFTEEEMDSASEKGWKPISLGDYRLRTETAGIYACSIINLINKE